MFIRLSPFIVLSTKQTFCTLLRSWYHFAAQCLIKDLAGILVVAAFWGRGGYFHVRAQKFLFLRKCIYLSCKLFSAMKRSLH